LTGAVTQVAFNDERGFQLGNFSTDGNWLVYSRRNEDLDDEVYLFEIANGAEHDVTQDPFRDTEGLITPDGRHVVFRSNRDDGTYQLFTVSLARLSEDPDDPLVRERRSLERRRADRGRGGEGNRGGGGGADTGGGQAQGEAAAGGDQAQDEAGAATELGTGFELAPAGDRYVVSYIYRDGPADKEWIDLQVGDAVVAIDHQRIAAPNNYWEILNHTLNDHVTVTVDASARASNAGGNGDAGASGVRGAASGFAGAAATASANGTHDIRIRTVNSLRDIKYEEWVENNRRYVEEISDGQIAYVHIRAMNQPSLVRFQNEIDRFWNAQGIVIDIRYNGGVRGHADGLSRPRPRPHRRHAHLGRGHRHRLLRPDQRRLYPHTRLTGGHLRSQPARQQGHQPGKLRRGARRVGGELTAGRARRARSRAEGSGGRGRCGCWRAGSGSMEERVVDGLPIGQQHHPEEPTPHFRHLSPLPNPAVRQHVLAKRAVNGSVDPLLANDRPVRTRANRLEVGDRSQLLHTSRHDTPIRLPCVGPALCRRPRRPQLPPPILRQDPAVRPI
jgi:hypothetical protein